MIFGLVGQHLLPHRLEEMPGVDVNNEWKQGKSGTRIAKYTYHYYLNRSTILIWRFYKMKSIQLPTTFCQMKSTCQVKERVRLRSHSPGYAEAGHFYRDSKPNLLMIQQARKRPADPKMPNFSFSWIFPRKISFKPLQKWDGLQKINWYWLLIMIIT